MRHQAPWPSWEVRNSRDDMAAVEPSSSQEPCNEKMLHPKQTAWRWCGASASMLARHQNSEADGPRRTKTKLESNRRKASKSTRPSDMQPARWRAPLRKEISLAKNKPFNLAASCEGGRATLESGVKAHSARPLSHVASVRRMAYHREPESSEHLSKAAVL